MGGTTIVPPALIGMNRNAGEDGHSLTLLWGVLAYMLLSYSKVIDFSVIFTLIASAIIVFVPIYKNKKKKEN